MRKEPSIEVHAKARRRKEKKKFRAEGAEKRRGAEMRSCRVSGSQLLTGSACRAVTNTSARSASSARTDSFFLFFSLRASAPPREPIFLPADPQPEIRVFLQARTCDSWTVPCSTGTSLRAFRSLASSRRWRVGGAQVSRRRRDAGASLALSASNPVFESTSSGAAVRTAARHWAPRRSDGTARPSRRHPGSPMSAPPTSSARSGAAGN